MEKSLFFAYIFWNPPRGICFTTRYSGFQGLEADFPHGKLPLGPDGRAANSHEVRWLSFLPCPARYRDCLGKLLFETSFQTTKCNMINAKCRIKVWASPIYLNYFRRKYHNFAFCILHSAFGRQPAKQQFIVREMFL